MHYLLPEDVKHKFMSYLYIKDVSKFMDMETSLLYGVVEFDRLFDGLGFWYRHDRGNAGKTARASTAFLKSQFHAFPKVDRLVMTRARPNCTYGVDEFGYNYVTIYGDKP